MSWKKNVFSYILWLVNTLAISVVGMLGLIAVVCEDLGFAQSYSFLISGIYYMLVGLFVLLMNKLVNRKNRKEWSESTGGLIVEGLLFVGLLAAGMVIRILQISDVSVTYSVSDMEYLETSMVAVGNVIPQVIHGATYVFLQLLHVVFLLFGNKFIVALWLQLVILLLSAVFFYFAVRKLAGRISALVMLAFMMLSPYMLESTIHISPEGMCFLIYAIVLWIIAETLQKNRCNLLVYVMVGLLIGVCCYLDLTGLTLLVFAAGVFSVERGKPAKCWNRRVAAFGWNILGALIGWCGLVVLDAMLSGQGFLNVMTAWLRLYRPEGFTFYPEGILTSPNMKANAIVLFATLVFGIFSFCYRKGRERQGIWIGALFLLAGFNFFQMMSSHMAGSIYMYLFYTVLAGVGVADIFSVHALKETVAAVQQTAKEDIADKYSATEKGTDKSVVEGNVKEEQAAPKIKLLENPLPLPKKHEAKVLNYRITEMTDYVYDYEVKDEDDFDIK